MSVQARTSSLGVDVFLPGAARRFATITRGSDNLIALLAEDDHNWLQVEGLITFDREAKAVAHRFVEAGYGTVRAATMWRT